MYLTFEMERLGRNLSQSVGVKMFRKFWGSYNWNWRLYINNVRKRTSSSFFKKQKFFLSNDSLEVYSKVISFGRKISADSSLQGEKYLCHLGLNPQLLSHETTVMISASVSPLLTKRVIDRTKKRRMMKGCFLPDAEPWDHPRWCCPD